MSESMRSEFGDRGIEFTCVMPSLVNTELTSGVRAGRGVKKAEPEDVADAIVAALREPRPDVFVPRAVGAINKFLTILPRSAREGIARFLDADKVMVEADMAGRAAYEERVTRCEPTPLETADEAHAEAPREPVA
jgi:short-subunit dehydrogenase